MSQKYEQRLGTDKMLPLILKMSIPVVLAQLVNMLYGIVDRIYIGRIQEYGTDALAGIGLTHSVILLISAFSAFVSGGGAPLAAIALGGGEREKAEKIIGNGCLLLIVFTILTSTITYVYMEPILKIMSSSDSVIMYAKDYLSIYLIGTFFVQVSTGLNPFINAQGRPGVGMASVLIGAIFNIILDPIFIFKFDMGIQGAAIATIISQSMSAAWILMFLTSKKASLRIRKKYLTPDWKVLKKMLSLGISGFVMSSTESLIGFVLVNRLTKFGDIYVSTLTVLQSSMQIISVPTAGFAQGFTPVLSYNYGHKDEKRVKQAFRIALSIIFTFMFVSVIVMILFREQVAGIFTEDEKLIEEVAKAMPYFLGGMSIFGLQRTCQNTFVALGQAKVSVIIALLRKVILLIPLSIILSDLIGVKGVFLAEGIADATAAIVCTMIFIIQFPKILCRMKSNEIAGK